MTEDRARAAGAPTILLVDDEESVLRLVARVLRRSGFEVLTAATPEDAERLAAEAPKLDLVVSDYLLPGCSGVELCDRLRRDRPSLRVLYMSGLDEQTVASTEGMGEGFAYVRKPFDPALLIGKIRELVGG